MNNSQGKREAYLAKILLSAPPLSDKQVAVVRALLLGNRS